MCSSCRLSFPLPLLQPNATPKRLLYFCSAHTTHHITLAMDQAWWQSRASRHQPKTTLFFTNSCLSRDGDWTRADERGRVNDSPRPTRTMRGCCMAMQAKGGDRLRAAEHRPVGALRRDDATTTGHFPLIPLQRMEWMGSHGDAGMGVRNDSESMSCVDPGPVTAPASPSRFCSLATGRTGLAGAMASVVHHRLFCHRCLTRMPRGSSALVQPGVPFIWTSVFLVSVSGIFIFPTRRRVFVDA